MSGASSCFPQGRWSGPASAPRPACRLGPWAAPSTRSCPGPPAVSAASFDTAGPSWTQPHPGWTKPRRGQTRPRVVGAYRGRSSTRSRPGLPTAPPGPGTPGPAVDPAGQELPRRGDGRPQPRRRDAPTSSSFFRPCGRGASSEDVPRPGPGHRRPPGARDRYRACPDCTQAPSPCPPPVADASPARRPRHRPRRRHRRLTSGHVPCDPALLGPDAPPPAAPDTELDARGAAATARESHSSPGCDPGATGLRARRRLMCVS